MKDFEGFIKNYATRDFIYFFAEKSIEIYKNQVEKLDEHLVCNITFPLNIIQHGFIHKQAKVMLSAWDIPNMAYLSITNANDYRNDIMTEQLAGRVVNLYRGYENKHSGSEYIENNGLPGIFKYLMGMSYEQFKYANPAWIYQNYNRNYHMLIGSPNINREKIVDINVITNELFGLTAEELLAVEWIIWWLCSIHPDPLSAPEELYREKENSILTKKNLERVISYYSVTYEQVRNSSLGKQIFYNKPFVITQKTKETIAVSFYLVQMMIADGLYWLIRDYYHNNHWGTKFIIAFGEMFEDYFEELAGLYLPKNSWHKIPEERKKSADYYVEVDEAVFLFELKSGLLGLGAKQQVPDVGQIDSFYNRNIKEAYEQLKVSEQEAEGACPQKILEKNFANDRIKNIEFPPEIALIRGMTKDTEKAISDAFDYIKSQYNIKINNNDYYFNDSLEAYTERIMRNYTSGALAAKSIDDLIAHVMMFQECETYRKFKELEEEVRSKFIK